MHFIVQGSLFKQHQKTPSNVIYEQILDTGFSLTQDLASFTPKLIPGRGLQSGDGAGKISVLGCPTIFDNSMARVCCVCSMCLRELVGYFSLTYQVLVFFLLLWETAQYRLKYCLKDLLNPKQPTNNSPGTSRNNLGKPLKLSESDLNMTWAQLFKASLA